MSTVIAIDGPAGAGKSTVAQALAEATGYKYINTGSLYRAVALAAVKADKDLNNLPLDFLQTLDLKFKQGVLYLDGVPLVQELRTPECAKNASFISKQPLVREYLLPIQRNSASDGWIVMEGRDIGTVVFPDAEFKFFITASIEERAKRRLAQKQEVAQTADLKRIIDEISARDQQDSNRDIAPLKPSVDSIIIDTTGLSITKVVDIMISHLR